MTLANGRKPYQYVAFIASSRLSSALSFRSRAVAIKRTKYSDKPCPRFTTTGALDQFILSNDVCIHYIHVN